MKMDSIKKILLSRRLFLLASDNLQSPNDISRTVGVCLLQDAVEVFLLSVAEEVNANIKNNTTFDQYINLINDELKSEKLPFRTKLISLNKLRVNAKHYGLIPSSSETRGLLVAMEEFFNAVTSSIFNKSFASISMIDLVNEGEEKALLEAAKDQYEKGNFTQSLIDCRKAFFIRFESKYDISMFENQDQSGGDDWFAFILCQAPFYARNKQYIEDNVLEPTDYIVFDLSRLEMDILKSGLDHTEFWNVFRKRSGG
ncbi:hypothetical protein [Desulfatibacillum aliphaticivorans]|uniref:hypothetical protein n=1 Tax=Desulfatibacillum aliphaticivorans TaxID=218208 RepID=UPI0006865C66|nr:hypothetical protein [Desulfatibacillum aliphaticivorans]